MSTPVTALMSVETDLRELLAELEVCGRLPAVKINECVRMARNAAVLLARVQGELERLATGDDQRRLSQHANDGGG